MRVLGWLFSLLRWAAHLGGTLAALGAGVQLASGAEVSVVHLVGVTLLWSVAAAARVCLLALEARVIDGKPVILLGISALLEECLGILSAAVLVAFTVLVLRQQGGAALAMVLAGLTLRAALGLTHLGALATVRAGVDWTVFPVALGVGLMPTGLLRALRRGLVGALGAAVTLLLFVAAVAGSAGLALVFLGLLFLVGTWGKSLVSVDVEWLAGRVGAQHVLR